MLWVFLFFTLTSFGRISEKEPVDSTFYVDEMRISQMANELISIRFDDVKLYELSKKLVDDFEVVLKKDNSFNYPFDSITSMGKVVSKNGNVRLFTWYAIRADGSHIHFGFVQYYNKSDKKVHQFKLIDKSDEIEDEKNLTLNANNWFGATYYEIVECKSAYGQLYVLLGWDGNTIFSNKKVIESLVFSDNGSPIFGKQVFVYGETKVKRIVFEYSRMASMMLKYDNELNLIVMDHLSPSKPVYQGNAQYYGPDLSYDALKLENGYWVYSPAIDYKPIVKKKKLFGRKHSN